MGNGYYLHQHRQTWCNLSTIIDLHSKLIIGYSFSKTMDSELVLRTLNDAIQGRDISGDLIIHSDLGAQYTGQAYNDRLKELHIKHSFSHRGCPYDNAEIESFHATLKKELVYQLPVYQDFETAKLSVFDYVFRFYNRKRIHSALGYATPAEFEKQAS